jgi:hypothetical protein
MPWFLLQRAVELLLCLLIWDTFSQCHDVTDALEVFHRLSPLAQIGAITVLFVVLASFGETIRRLIEWVRGN